MAIDKDCIGFARDCEQLARLIDNPEVRERLVQMAREWRAQAMGENKLPSYHDGAATNSLQ